MPNSCKHCGTQLPRPAPPLCPTCRRPLRKNQNRANGVADAPHLVVREPGQPVQTVSLDNGLLTIGRALTNDLVLKHPAVSRRHARLELRGNEYWLIDLDSANGLTINGQRVKSHVLQDGDVFHIVDQQNNSIEIIFHHKGDDTENEKKESKVHFGLLPVAIFRGAKSNVQTGSVALDQLATFTIGRAQDNQLYLDHPAVSRYHARVEQKSYGYQIRDLNSSNGTFVNGKAITGTHPVYINNVIQIGPFKLIYNEAGFSQHALAGNYRLDAVGLIHEFRGSGSLDLYDRPAHSYALKNINLSIYPRELVALVGGSGAGKSTLLNALSGFSPAKKGQVFLNGDDLYVNFAAYRNILGYVPQDDIIHGQLPVRSALTYAAQLRLPDAGPAEIRQRVDQVLQEVDMVGHDSKQIKRLSGGQRKRVSIAVELLADPGLFFLDEPTSGLDPNLARKVINIMRRLADNGRTIVLATHTTASIAQCTQVAFMADGHLVYFGPPREAVTFFRTTSIPEIYDRLSQPLDSVKNPLPAICQDNQQDQATSLTSPRSTAEAWADCFRISPQYQQYVANRLQTAKGESPASAIVAQPFLRHASSLRQFWILCQRYFDLITRDSIRLFVLFAVMPVIAALLLFTANPHDLVGKDADTIEKEMQTAIEQQREAADPDQPGIVTSPNDLDDDQYQATYLVVDQAQKLLFVMTLAASLLGIFAASYEIIKEEAIYRRERMLNLKLMPYLLSKVTVLTLFAIVQCFLFLLILGLRVHYPAHGVFMPAVAEMYLTLLLATVANISLGLFISAIVRSSGSVVYVILIVLFFQIIFAQAIFNLPALARPLSYLTTTRWTLEALGSSINMDALREKESACVEFADYWKQTALEVLEDADPPCREGQLKQKIDYELILNYDHNSFQLLFRWLVLVEFALIFLLFTFVAQKRKDLV